MDMQDVDYELVYEPGRDEQDPLDFLSRHPLPENGTDNTEKVIKYTIESEHAIVLDRITEETARDKQLQKGIRTYNQRRLGSGTAEISIYRRFYHIKHELYVANGFTI